MDDRVQKLAQAEQQYEEHSKFRPPLLLALAEDAAMYCAHRGEPYDFKNKLQKWMNVVRLLWVANDYFGLALYRVRATLQAHHVPVIPRLLDHICSLVFRVQIGDKAVLREGVCLAHGNIGIYGVTLIGRKCFLAGSVGIGLVQDDFRGPELADGVSSGTGAQAHCAKTLRGLGEGGLPTVGYPSASRRSLPGFPSCLRLVFRLLSLEKGRFTYRGLKPL